MHTDKCFDPLTDRYAFDRCFTPDRGYAQIDTSQDAAYFGTWASPSERKIITYAEGDVTYQTAENDQEFAEAIRSLWEWNRERGFLFGIDPGGSGKLVEEFKALGLGELLQWGGIEAAEQTLGAMESAGGARSLQAPAEDRAERTAGGQSCDN